MPTHVPCELCATMAADEELVPNLQNLCRRGEVGLVIMPTATLALWDDSKMMQIHYFFFTKSLSLHHLALSLSFFLLYI